MLIRAPFVDWILDGLKVWEMRSRRTTMTRRISRSARSILAVSAVIGIAAISSHQLRLKNVRRSKYSAGVSTCAISRSSGTCGTS